MNVFFLEIWHDLREKRLWPVAAGLLVALVAIPVVMLKPGSSAGGGDVAPAPKAESVNSLLPVKLAEGGAKGSDLKAFDSKNPFKPGVKLGGAGSSIASLVAPNSSKLGSDGGSDKGASTGAGGTVGAPTTGTTPTTPTKKTARYTYVVDVTFVKNGRASRRTGLRKLSMLPNADAPLLLFLGVDAKADNAIFLVDSTLKTFGEGSCDPSPQECGVLSLGSGAEHEFTDAEDNSFGLRIDEIRRVPLKASSAKSAKSSRRSVKASASVGATSKRRFSPPFLTDYETETTTTGTER